LEGTKFIPLILRDSSRPTDCRRSSLRPVPQHRQKIQADQMRDAPFLAGRLLTPELTAEYAGRGQFRREPALDRRSIPGEWLLPEQIAGLPGRTCSISHIAPRTRVTGCCQTARHACDARCASASTGILINSFRFAAHGHCTPRHIAQRFLLWTARQKRTAPSRKCRSPARSSDLNCATPEVRAAQCITNQLLDRGGSGKASMM
jgi:hypothetical protein